MIKPTHSAHSPDVQAVLASEGPVALDAVARVDARQAFEAHAAFVGRAARHLGTPASEVPDVVQEVFLVVHQKLGEFEGRSSLRSWIYGICLRIVAKHRRRHSTRYEVATDSPPEVAASNGPEQALESSERRARLTRALDALDSTQREVFVLFEIERLSMKEICAALDCPLQTGYSRLHAARERVRRAFEEQR